MKIEQKDGLGVNRGREGESRQEAVWGHTRTKKYGADKGRKIRDVKKDRWLESEDR